MKYFLSIIISLLTTLLLSQSISIDSTELKFPSGFPNEIKGVELSLNKRFSLAYSSTYNDNTRKYTVKVHDVFNSNELFSEDGIEFDKIELNKVSNKSFFYSLFKSGIISVQKFNNELDSVKNIEIGKTILNFNVLESRLINVLLEDEIRLYDFSGNLLKNIKTSSKIVNTCYSSCDNIILISENGVISIFDQFNLQLINSFASIPLNDLHKNKEQLWNELSEEIKYSITGQSSMVYPTESRIKSKVETYLQENKILKLDYSRKTNKLICYRKTKTNIFYNSNDVKIFTSELVNKDWGFRKNTQYNSENESIYFLNLERDNKRIDILHLDSLRYEKMTFPEEILFYSFWNNQRNLKIKTKSEAYFYELIDGKYILEKKILDNEQLDWNGSTLKNNSFSDLWLVINHQPELDFIKTAIDSKTLISNHIGAVQFSNDEKFMILAGRFDFQLIELGTLKTLIKSGYTGKESKLVFSPCSQFLFFQSEDSLKIFNLNNLKNELSLKLDDDCADWGSEWRINIPKSLIVFSLKMKNNKGLVKLFSFSKSNIFPKNLCSFGNNNEMFFDDFIEPSFSRDNNSLFLKSAHKLFIYNLVNQCQKDSIFLEFPRVNVATSSFRGEYERTIISSVGVKSGYGEQFENNKLIYQGSWKYNYKHGKGKFFYDNGNVYEGDFKFDKRSGFGTLFFPNGDKYVGEFFNDKRNGKGIYTWANGKSKEYYYIDGTENDFDNRSICINGDCQNGTGTIQFSNGNKYEGSFFRGMKNGSCKEITSDGIVYYEGDYLNNVRHGFGLERDSKGKVIYEGPYTEGVKLGFRKNNFGQECLVSYGFASEESRKLPINNLIEEITGSEALFFLQSINEIDSNILMLLFGENTDNSVLISSQVMLFNLKEKKVIGIFNNQPKINDLETELNRTYPWDVAFNDSIIAVMWSYEDRKTYERKLQLTLYNTNTLHKNEISYKIPKSYTSLFMHKNSNNLIVNLSENSQLNLNLIDYNIKNFHSSGTSSPTFSSSMNLLALWDAEWEGSIQNSDIEFFNDGKKVFSVYYFGFGEENFDFLIKLKSGYYFSPKSMTKLLYYIDKKSGRRIGFEQLDPVYNRPDIVLDSIGKYFGGADADLVANYRQSWEKRIDRLGLDKEKLGKGEIAVPDAEIVEADKIAYENKEGKLVINVKAIDPKYTLRRFNVYVNEVPLYGSAGISIAHLNTKTWTTTDTIPLSLGENKIQVSVMNELGLENFKYPTYVNYTPEKDKEIFAKTHYIGIGVNRFKEAGHNLNYCVKDVRDLAKAFSAENTKIDTLLFADEQVTKENILALKEYLKKTSVNDKVIISCSSHGLLDDSLNFYLAMYDVDFKNPKARGLKYEELESLLDGIPARQKLLLLDACNSGENDKTEIIAKEPKPIEEKSFGAKGEPFSFDEEKQNNFIKMNELFVNVRNNTGSVIISAAGGQESALEAIQVDGKTIENGAFTYSILECLKQNEGKELKVNTLKKYAEKRVEEITNGKQKPTSRQETMEVDWIIK